MDKPTLRGYAEDIIWARNSRDDTGVTVNEVVEKINARGGDVSKRRVREELNELVEQGELRRMKGASNSAGRPPWLYYYPEFFDRDEGEADVVGQESQSHTSESTTEQGSTGAGDSVIETNEGTELRSTTDREYAEEEKDAAERRSGDEPTEFPLMEEIKQAHLNRSEYAEAIRKAAPSLAKEDPRALLLEMANWLIEKIESLRKEVHDAHDGGDLRSFRDRKDELEALVRLGEWYFERIFRLDYEDTTAEPILEIPDADEMFEKGADYDTLPSPTLHEDRAEDRLEERVDGDQVLNVWDCDLPDSAAGADSSVAEIGLASRGTSMLRQTSIEVYTGAAALSHEDRSYTDYDFEGTSLSRYRRRDAFTDGLLLSPSIRGLTHSERNKARYAALDLRLYNQVHRILSREAKWRPVGDRDDLGKSLRPDLVFMDGRITPLVHQISDYASTSIYGELARNEMRRYADLLEKLGSPRVDTALAGVVKQTNLTWLAPLVFYYLNEHTDASIGGEDDDIPREIYQPPISDPVVASLLYDGLTRESAPPDGTVYVTFRVRRRFYDYSLDRNRDFPLRTPKTGDTINPERVTDWEDYFSEFVEDRKDRDHDVTDDEFEDFSYLCATAGTTMCYAAPTGIYDMEGTDRPLLLPRIEVFNQADRAERQDLEAALAWFSAEPEFDEDHADEDRSTLEDAPVLVPKVVVDSDWAAKFLRSHVGRAVEKDFRQLIAEARDLEENDRS